MIRMKTMQERLASYYKRGCKLTLSSEIEEDEEIYHGYIIKLTSNYACLWLVTDWHYDGILILPIRYITDITYGKYEKTYHRILKSEGALKDMSKPKWLNVGSFKSAFKSLMKNEKIVTVESRLLDINEFVIGNVVDLTDKEVHIKGFDAAAKWRDGVYKIPYKEITSLKFDDEYSSVFKKYVKET